MFGRVQVSGSLIISDCGGHVIKFLQRPSWLEILRRRRQCYEFFRGGHYSLVEIALSRLTLSVHDDQLKKAGPVNIDMRIEVIAMETVEP